MSRDPLSASQTNWDLIQDAVSGSESAARSLEAVVRQSWTAVFAFIRATGRNPETASDLTQGFVTDVVLARRLLSSADPAHGRFRTLLMNAVKNYLCDVHRAQNAKKRAPENGFESFEHAENALVDDSPAAAQEFATRWTACLVRNAAERARIVLRESGDDLAWTLFEARILKPAYDGGVRPTAAELAQRFGIGSSAEVALKIAQGKRRFAEALLSEISATIQNPNELRAEVRDLLALLSGH